MKISVVPAQGRPRTREVLNVGLMDGVARCCPGHDVKGSHGPDYSQFLFPIDR